MRQLSLGAGDFVIAVMVPVMPVMVMRPVATLAMRVNVLMLAMIMMSVTVMSAIMVSVIMVSMIMLSIVVVAVGVRRARSRIGAAFRIERRLDLDDAAAEPLHHVGDHVVAADANPFFADLGRQMTIADMPGKPRELARADAANLQKRLGRGDDLDKAPILQHQRVAAAQRRRLGEVEQKGEPARRRHRHAAAVAIVKAEHDRIGGVLVPVAGRPHRDRAYHRHRFQRAR